MINAINDFLNGDSSRFKLYVEASQLDEYYYVKSEAEKELSDKKQILALISEDSFLGSIKDESNNISQMVDNSKEQKDGSYKCVVDGKELLFTKEEFDELNKTKTNLDNYINGKDKQIETLNKEISELETSLSNKDKKEFSYRSMNELDKGISTINNKIQDIKQETRDVKNSIYEKEYDEKPSHDETVSKLEDKSVNEWFSLKNDDLDGEGWSCIKLNDGKYSVMNGNKETYKKYNSEEELIEAGFYVAPDHRFSLSK